MYRSMMQVYVKNSDLAVPFYQKVFNAPVLVNALNAEGKAEHVELDIFGQVLAISESLESETVTGNSMQFCLDFGEGKQELVEKIIENLSDGGKFNYHGSTDWSPLVADIVDKFGVRWCIFV